MTPLNVWFCLIRPDQIQNPHKGKNWILEFQKITKNWHQNIQRLIFCLSTNKMNKREQWTETNFLLALSSHIRSSNRWKSSSFRRRPHFTERPITNMENVRLNASQREHRKDFEVQEKVLWQLLRKRLLSQIRSKGPEWRPETVTVLKWIQPNPKHSLHGRNVSVRKPSEGKLL